MSRVQITSHYKRLLAAWPTDRLRPFERTLQSVFRARATNAPSTSSSPTSTSTRTPARENAELNAAYVLADNQFAQKFPLSREMMSPASNPGHYKDLKRELAEAPDRTFMGGVWKRISGLVRMK